MPEDNLAPGISDRDDEDSARWRREFNLTSLSDLDFEVGRRAGYPVGMKSSYPADVKRAVWAALLSKQMGLSSIDYTLKRYVKADAYEGKNETLGFQISAFLSQNIEASRHEYIGFTSRHVVRLGDQIADMNMMRLNVSLEGAKLLANRGLLFESQCIVRFILEQLAWCYKCHSLCNEDKILALQSKECLAEFKTIYPTSGRLYGHLSDIAHWDPNHHHLFVSDVSSTLTSRQFMAIALCYAVLAFDMYHALIEVFYPDREMEFKVFTSDRNFDNTRRTKALVEKVREKIS